MESAPFHANYGPVKNRKLSIWANKYKYKDSGLVVKKSVKRIASKIDISAGGDSGLLLRIISSPRLTTSRSLRNSIRA